MRHENINPFIGCYTDPKLPALVYEYATRGSLEVIINFKKFISPLAINFFF